MSGERIRNRLKVFRAERDWTQADLAERVGVTRKSINAIERGHFVPSTVLALRLARLLGAPVEEIFQLPEDAG
jgi:putative transcriptional regulator